MGERTLLAFSILAILVCTSPDKSVGSDELLAKMRSFDAVYLSALTVTCSEVEPPSLGASYLDERRFTFTLTLDKDRKAVVRRIDNPDLRYRRPAEFEKFKSEVGGVFSGLKGVSFDKNNNFNNSLMSYKAISFDSERTTWVEVWTSYSIAPSGKLLSKKEDRSVLVYGPDSATLTFPISKVLWAMGRGYAGRLSEIISQETQATGQVKVLASGYSLSELYVGKWELVVDPARQYIVRSAKFFKGESQEPNIKISCGNLVQGDEVVYPENAQFEMSRQRTAPTRYQFGSCKLAVSEVVIRDAYQACSNTDSPRTLTIDSTVVPEKTRYVNHNGLTTVSRPLKNRSRGIWVFLAILSFLALGAVMAVRHFRSSPE